MSRQHHRRTVSTLLVAVLAAAALVSLPGAASADDGPSITISPSSGPNLTAVSGYTTANELDCTAAPFGYRSYLYWFSTTAFPSRLATITNSAQTTELPDLDPGVIIRAGSPILPGGGGEPFPNPDGDYSWFTPDWANRGLLSSFLTPGASYTFAVTCGSSGSTPGGIDQGDGSYRYTIAWTTFTVDASGAWSVPGGAVQSAATTTGLSATRSGKTASLTATVTSNGAPVTDGKVEFSEGGTTLGEQPVSGVGVASFTTGELTAGTHTLTATYVPASNAYAESTGSAAVDISADAVTTQTEIAPVLNADNTATLAATVTGAGSPVAGGTVQFRDGTTAVGSPATVGSDGKATFTTPVLAAGSHTFSAVYTHAPGADFTNSISLDAVITVADAPSEQGTSLALAAVAAVTTAGELSFGLGAVVFEDGKSASDAAGTVQFSRDGKAIGDPVAISGGTAALRDTDVKFDTSYSYKAVFTPAEGSTLKTAESPDVSVSMKAATMLTGGATITPGAVYRVVAPDGTFNGNETVTGEIRSTPTPIGTSTATAAGGIAFTFTAPSGLEPGAHSIVLTGASGKTYTLAVSVANAGGKNTPASFATDWVNQVRDNPALLAGLLGALVLFAAAGIVGWNVFWRRRGRYARS
ncbi:Ig-like domain repeat protein [uncultured Microbacterium sp.]|uniref:Ig-like domain repeat protein n=1 Tax=uncultured Microbacterium sp. TaxID=191216 RepID=UPI0035CAF2BC